jgi:quercetin dioxygenase-like cupin family protein
VSGAEDYFAKETAPASDRKGQWVQWDALEPLELVPGLRFQPVLGDNVMVNFVHFEPHTEAPLHWHDEEQIVFVVEGEFEFEVAGEKRLLKRGEALVIPPNVPHAARTFDQPCLEVDVFHPPRRGLLDALRKPE